MIPTGYIRVTEPLSLLKTFDHIDPAVLKVAADRGTRVHSYCEMYMKNLFIPCVDEDCKPYFDSFVDWYSSCMSNPLFVEERFNCPDYNISGQVDIIGTINGDNELSIIDIKTPQSVSPTWALQTAAYQFIVNKETQLGIKRRMCLMLCKFGKKAKIIEYDNYAEDERLYFNLLELYKHFYL